MAKTKTEYDITSLEAATILGMHPGTLANWRVKRIGPKFQKDALGLNARVFYNRAELREFAEGMKKTLARR